MTFVNTVALLAGSFGGINLEDISAPRCFEIERKLKDRVRHPRVPRRPARHCRHHPGRPHQRPEGGGQAAGGGPKVVTNGAGAAAISIIKLLLSAGYHNDHHDSVTAPGAIYAGAARA